MELSIIIEDKKGVINITSEQFIIEDLKAHICSKMGLEQSEYKVAVRCGLNPSLELIRVPSLKMVSDGLGYNLNGEQNKDIADVIREEQKQKSTYYDLSTAHLIAHTIQNLTSVELGFKSKKAYTLDRNDIKNLVKYMIRKGGLDYIIYYQDVVNVMKPIDNQLLSNREGK